MLMVIGMMIGLYSPRGDNRHSTVEPARQHEGRKETSFIQCVCNRHDTIYIHISISDRLFKY